MPVCTFHPNDVQANDVAALFRAAGSFYAGAEERVRGVVWTSPQAGEGKVCHCRGESRGKRGFRPLGVASTAAPRPPRAHPRLGRLGRTVVRGRGSVASVARVASPRRARRRLPPRGGGHVEGGSRGHVGRRRAGRRRGHTGVHPGRRVRGVAEEPHDPRRRPGPAGELGVTLARRWSPSPSRGGRGVKGDGGSGTG